MSRLMKIQRSNSVQQSLRAGFTLIELLLVIAILAVLTAMSLAVMRSATEEAKASATRSRIARIEAMLQLELENYEVRRLPINLTIGAGPNDALRVRDLKRRILADIISAEMPRPVPVAGTTPNQPDEVTFTIPPASSNPDLGVFPTTQPPLNNNGTVPQDYKIGFDINLPMDQTGGFDSWLGLNYPTVQMELSALKPAVVNAWARLNGDASFNLPGEYLYEIIKRIDQDGSSGIEGLGNAAIGNSDSESGDPWPEIVDAWGAPMEMRILQVEAIETPPGSGIWIDQPTNWNKLKPNGIPEGYVLLNPVIPRRIDQIRFQIISKTLGADQ
jgi:prepilin-type N-terminal cleavage/methylation domain-containing protein